jgi:hypothetical protein
VALVKISMVSVVFFVAERFTARRPLLPEGGVKLRNGAGCV